MIRIVSGPSQIVRNEGSTSIYSKIGRLGLIRLELFVKHFITFEDSPFEAETFFELLKNCHFKINSQFSD